MAFGISQYVPGFGRRMRANSRGVHVKSSIDHEEIPRSYPKEPTQPAHSYPLPPTPKQLQYLASLGYTGSEPSTRKEASDFIAALTQKKTATPKMLEELHTPREQCRTLRLSLTEHQEELSDVRARLHEAREQLGRSRVRERAVQSEFTDAAKKNDALAAAIIDLKRAQDVCLKKLLILAHPDKWSQGQPATQLAHEIAIVINDLRHQEGGR
jgi:hypothetical protein